MVVRAEDAHRAPHTPRAAVRGVSAGMRRALFLAAPLAAGGLLFAAGRRLRRPPVGPDGEVRLVDGERIHVVERGEGPVIVLIHGFLGNIASWRYVVDDLARDHRVIAVDLPGFGFSDRDPRL